MKKFILTILALIAIAGGTFLLYSRNKPQTVGPAPVSSPSPAASAMTRTFTRDEVSAHASTESCYAIIRGTVYDLTPFIRLHPGGAERIISLCGADGTAAFEGQHGGNSRAENTLAQYNIGTLAQ